MIGLTPESSIEDLKDYALLCHDEGVFEVFVDPATFRRIVYILKKEIFTNPGFEIPHIDEERIIFRDIFIKPTEETLAGSSSTWRGFRFETLLL
jgi:hypothetical protein